MRKSNQIIKNIFLKKSISLFSARVLPLLSLFIITILYSRKLSFTDYGIYQSFWMYTNILTVTTGFGITTMILSTPLTEFLNTLLKFKHKVYIIVSILNIAAFAVFLIFAKNLSNKTISLIFIFSLVQLVNAILESLLIKNEKETKLLLINSIYAILFLMVHVVLVLDSYNLDTLIFLIIALNIIKSFFLFDINYYNSAPEFEIKNDGIFKNWYFCGLNEIIGVVSKWIDKIFLLYLLTVSQFAIFFNGSFEIPLFGILITVAGNLLMVEVSKNQNSSHKIVFAFNQNFKLLSLIVFPIFFFLLFNASKLFAITFHHKYDASIPVFVISLLILPIRINNYGALLQTFQKANKVMTGSLLDLIIVLILMFFLYPYFGTRGVAAAVVLGTYVQVIYYLIWSAKSIGVPLSHLVPFKYLISRFLTLLIIYFLFSNIPIRFSALNYLLLQGGLSILIIFVGIIKFNYNHPPL